MPALRCCRCRSPLTTSEDFADRPPRCPACGGDWEDQEASTLAPTPPTEAETMPPAAAAPEAATLAPGAAPPSDGSGRVAIPGYAIERELGRGGMGVVYQALDLRLKRRVALKMVLSGGHAGEADLARFRTEAEAVARLQHPNIVQIHEVGTHEGLPFFCLEFCPGGSLDRKLDGTPLPPQEAAALVEQLARAMHAAHQKDVIHRDLKPANVLLTEDGTPKITDFGLARKLDEVGQTQSGSIMGTPSYMAPEQAGGSKDIGPACDVYALGAILYELLTGRPPFKAATSLDTVLQVISDEPVPPRQLQSQTPKDLETIALKCLRKEPARRYGSAGELAEDLQRFVRGEPIRARPVGRLERAIKWVRRNKGLSAGLTAAVLAVLIGMGVASWQAVVARIAANREASQRRQAEEERERAEAEKRRADDARRIAEQEKTAAEVARREAEGERNKAEAEKKRAEDQLKRAELALYAAQLAQAQREWQDGNGAKALEILEGCQHSLRHFEHRHLWTLYTSNQKTFRGHRDRINSVCYSADGKYLASAGGDWNQRGELKVWNAETGQEVLGFKGHSREITCVCFSPDGKRFATASYDNTVKVWDVPKGKELLCFKGHPDWGVLSVCFSPDGKRLASSDGQGNVKVWDADGGRVVFSSKATQFACRVDSVCFSSNGKHLASASAEGTVTVWDIQKGQAAHSFRTEQGGSRLCYSPDGKRLAVASKNSVQVWDADKQQQLFSLPGGAQGVCFSPNGKQIATAREDRTVRVWDAEKGNEIVTLRGHAGFVSSVCFHPDGKQLASAGGNVIVWDAEKGQEVVSHRVSGFGIDRVLFSPDSRLLAGDDGSGTAKVWDAARGQEILSLTKAARVCFGPDSQRLAFSDPEGTVKVWDIDKGQEIRSFKGLAGWARDLSFSPDGKHLAALSTNGAVQVWNIEKALVVFSLKATPCMVGSLCFSPDGQRLSVARGNWARPGELKVWDL